MDGPLCPLFIMHRNKYTDVPKKGSRGICFGASPFILPTFILKTWGLVCTNTMPVTKITKTLGLSLKDEQLGL